MEKDIKELPRIENKEFTQSQANVIFIVSRYVAEKAIEFATPANLCLMEESSRKNMGRVIKEG